MADNEDRGATSNEQLLAAARSDNEDQIVEILSCDDYDINCKDGLGNTPLHNAYEAFRRLAADPPSHLILVDRVMNGSTDVLEHILSDENCDVDPQNRIQGATPLHLAALIEHKDLRKYIFESLLEAGADTTIQDKNGHTVLDYISADDTVLRGLIRKHQAQTSVSQDDVASDDDGEPGSGSASGDD